jgi:hypothetical protein
MTDGADAGTRYFQAGVTLLVLAPFVYRLIGGAAVLPLMLVGFMLSVIGLWWLVYQYE